MNIPNYLTFTRIIISPIFLFIYMMYGSLGISYIALPYVLLSLLIIAELTDAFDGLIARRYNQVTELGKILDPMADTVVHISVFLSFTLDPIRLPIPLVFIFFYRDAVISTLRTLCALKGFALAARTSGKIKAIMQAVAAITVVVLMIPHSLGYLSTESLQSYAAMIVGVAAIYTIYSGIEYMYANRRFLNTP